MIDYKILIHIFINFILFILLLGLIKKNSINNNINFNTNTNANVYKKCDGITKCLNENRELVDCNRYNINIEEDEYCNCSGHKINKCKKCKKLYNKTQNEWIDTCKCLDIFEQCVNCSDEPFGYCESDNCQPGSRWDCKGKEGGNCQVWNCDDKAQELGDDCKNGDGIDIDYIYNLCGNCISKNDYINNSKEHCPCNCAEECNNDKDIYGNGLKCGSNKRCHYGIYESNSPPSSYSC